MNIAIVISIDIMYIHLFVPYVHIRIRCTNVPNNRPFFRQSSPRAVSWTGLKIPQEAAGGWLSGHHIAGWPMVEATWPWLGMMKNHGTGYKNC